MKGTHVFLALFLLTGAIFAEDRVREKADELLRQAYEASAQTEMQRAPYEEEGTFTFLNMVNKNERGTYLKAWADSNNSIEGIRLDGYQKLVVKKDGKFYRHENTTFTPRRVEQLEYILRITGYTLDDTDIVRRIRNRNFGSTPATCIELDTVRGARKASQELCLGKNDSLLVYFQKDDLEYFWSDYRVFRGKRLPAHIEVREHGDKIIEADRTFKEAEALKPASIIVPAGLAADSVCRTKLPPVLRSAPGPEFPVGVAKYNGSVVLAILVNKDGSVQDSQVLQSLDSVYDHEAQRVIKSWKFSPALCDGQPEEMKMCVEVHFPTR